VGHVAGYSKQLLLVDACMSNSADQADELPSVQTENKLFATIEVQTYGLL